MHLWFSIVDFPSCLRKRYGIEKIRQWEPVGWVMAGKNYPHVESGICTKREIGVL
jgi:hypothetical protein